MQEAAEVGEKADTDTIPNTCWVVKVVTTSALDQVLEMETAWGDSERRVSEGTAVSPPYAQ